MTKMIAPLLLALAVGCSYHPVGGSRENANPPFSISDHTHDEDGIWNVREPDVYRVMRGPEGIQGQDPGALINAAKRTLMVLIHGCNNTYPEARRSCELARMLMAGKDLIFLEVYWDGGTGNPLALWGHAREHSKWAGLGLRRLLRGLDPALEASGSPSVSHQARARRTASRAGFLADLAGSGAVSICTPLRDPAAVV
jgi:hypothetical protein